MSLIASRPRNDTTAQSPSVAQPFRQTHPAPAFRPEVMRSLRMHPTVALFVGLAVFVGLLILAYTIRPVYLAESRVYIEPAASSPLNDPNGGGLFDATKYDSYVQQQMQTATRLDILGAAVRSVPQSTWREFGPTQQAAALALQNTLKVDRVTTSYQMSIQLKGSDAEKTAAMVNAVTTAYLDAGKKDEVARTDSRRQILEEERERIVAELAADRAEQAELSKNMGVASAATEGGNRYDAQLAALRGQLIAAREAHEAAAAQLSSVASPNATAALGLDAQATDAIAGDPGLATLKSSLNQRRAALLTQMQGLKPENPIYKQDQDELADLDRSIDIRAAQMRELAARRLQDKLRTDLARTGDLEARLNADVARETAAATGAAPKLQRAEELTSSIARLTARFATVDDALRTIALETDGLPMAHLSLAAAVPVAPEASRRRLVLISALPLAILLGCFAAAAVHRRDQHVYIARDMEDVLGFAPIAVLPARQDVSDRAIEEYVLRLAGGVEGAYRNDGARTFVLTPVSAATSIQALVESLARKLENLGLDVARTRAGEMLLDAGPGSASGMSSRSRALAADGARVSLAATALEQLKTVHDLIFIDAPALLTSAEAEYVARCADATILVAECGVTLKDELYQSAALLERLQVTGVGTVLEELRLRYADSAFRNAVMLVEKRTQAATIPKTAAFGRVRVATDPGGAPMYEPIHHPSPEPVDLKPTATEQVAYAAASVPAEAHAAPAFAEQYYAPPVPAEPAFEAAAHPEAAEPPAEPRDQFADYEREVWPARPARAERPHATRQAEEEMLSASGTAVFLKPRRVAVERLEPLGEQASLSYSADMLANSFGPLPVDIEPERSYQILPRGVSAEDAAAELRASNERKAAEIRRRWQANGGTSPDPLETNEIRRLLTPSGPADSGPARPGKDMIGARDVSNPPRLARPQSRSAEGDSGMSEKKGWLQKIFQRETVGDYKIAPDPEFVDDAPAVGAAVSGTQPPATRPHTSPSFAPQQYAARPAQTPAPPERPAPVFRPVASVMAPRLPVDELAPPPASAPAPVRLPLDISDMIQATARRAAPAVAPAPAPVAAAAAPVAPQAPAYVPPAPQVPVAREQDALAAAAAIVAESASAPARAAAPPSPFLSPIVPPRRPKSFTELSQGRRPGVATEAPAARSWSTPVTAAPAPVEPAAPVQVAAAAPAAPEPVVQAIAPESIPETVVVAPVEPPAPVVEAAAPVESTYPAITTPSWEIAPQVRSSGLRWPERPVAAPAAASPDPDSRQRWAVQPTPEQLPHWPPRPEPPITPASDSGARIPTNLLDVQGPALSRRWGLLSRYQATEEVESDRS